MKNGEFIYANSRADFLNKAFGTNYTSYGCVWKYDEEWVVWMVRFNKKDGGWQNTFVSDNRIKEENIANRKITKVDKKKIVIEIDDSGMYRKYIFRGKYVYDEINSELHTVHYYDKVSDTF